MGQRNRAMSTPSEQISPRDDCRLAMSDPSVGRRRRFTGWRKWLLRLLLVVLAPVLFLGGVEGGLRVAGYGWPTGFFVKIGDSDDLTANEKFCWRFYPPETASQPHPLRMSARKPSGTVRVFILGGSAAWGTPDPAFNFGRILEVMLRDGHGEVQFEVINAAVMGINSHIVLPIARDCARQQPDLFVVYMGNNEVVGLFGPGTDSGHYGGNLWLMRSTLWAKSTKLGQLLGDLLRYGGRDARAAEAQDQQYFLDHRVAADDPRREAVYRNFRANLEDLCRVAVNSQAKMIVSTVAVNLKDSPPFGSLHCADLTPEDRARFKVACGEATAAQSDGRYEHAVQHYLAAAEIDDRYADLHFRLGQCYLAANRLDEARRHYVLARDLDAIQFRTDGRLNEIIRDVAANRSQEGTYLVDAERALARCKTSPQGIAGEELFYEHVHLRFAGNYELARALYPAVVAALGKLVGEPADGPPIISSREQCANRLGLTAWHEARLAVPMVGLTSRAPFTGQFDHQQRQQRAEQALQDLLADAKRRAEGRVAPSAENTGDGRAAGAPKVPREALQHFDRANTLGKQGRMREAITEYRRAIHIYGEVSSFHNNLGVALLSFGEPDEGIEHLSKAVELAPSHGKAHFTLGRALASRGRLQEAIHHLRRAMELNVTSPGLPGHLAWLLATAGDARLRDGPEAVRLAERASRASQRKQPSALDALAAAYAETDRFDDAVRTATEAQRLAKATGNRDLAAAIGRRTELYRQKKPFRQP